MRQEISELTSTELENSTDSLALIFASKYAPSPIQLHEPVHEDVGQVEKVVERIPSQSLPGLPRRSGGKVTKKVQRLKLKVPYSGEKYLLHKRPSSHTSSFPTYDELTDREVVHYVDYTVERKDAEEIKNTIDKDISRWHSKLKDYVTRLNKNIRKTQTDFEKRARRRIKKHRGNMEAKEEALAELGISTQNVEQGFVQPKKKKEINLPDLDGSTLEKHTIREQTFVDVLDIIDSMRVSVERSKNRVRELDEESLRDIFLGAIDSHYGSATSESFNRGGKTDILLKHQGENLFVAECKFWTGKKGFQDAVDQLLDNLTRDDSHAALLIFSNREKFTQVRDRVDKAVEDHEDFQSILTQFTDHDVYQFQIPSGTKTNVAVKVVDLSQ